MAEAETENSKRFSRRGLITGVGAAGVMGLAAGVMGLDRPPREQTSAKSVSAEGAHQAGIERPGQAQSFCLATVLDFEVRESAESLVQLGRRIVGIAGDGVVDREILPDGRGDLTITVGVGNRVLAESKHPELAESVLLPEFSGDAPLDPQMLGGDLLLLVNASNPTILEPVSSALEGELGESSIRWREFGFRGPAINGAPRNSFGFRDGIVGPKTADEFRRNVWIEDGPLKDGSICAIRRFALDIASFRSLSSKAQNAIFGRDLLTGAPLSGGRANSEINLDAKRPDGSLLVPLHAHARAAHPSFTGSKLMHRRGYSFRNPQVEAGHMFISFQNEIETFSRTQLRLDEVDALREFTTPLSTAAFAILPGMNGKALGGSLF